MSGKEDSRLIEELRQGGAGDWGPHIRKKTRNDIDYYVRKAEHKNTNREQYLL